MKSFFRTPEKRQRNILLAGDLTVVGLGLALTLFVQMSATGQLDAFVQPIARLPLFPKIIAVVNLSLIFLGLHLLFGLIHLTVCHVVGLYEVEVIFDRRRTVTKLGIGVAASIVGLAASLNFLSRSLFTPELWAFYAGALFFFLLAWRFIFFKKISSREPYDVLLIGEDPLARQAVTYLSSNGSKKFFRFKTLDKDAFFKGNGSGPAGNGQKYQLIVYPFMNKLSGEELAALVKRKFEGTSICNSLTFYKNSTGSYPVFDLDPQWLIDMSVSLNLKSHFQQRIKRIFDIAFSLVNILLTLPAFAIIAALIKLTSKGPALYIHERLGMNGRPFRLIKFRTMIQNAEKHTGPVWASRNDPRITPVGRFLRKTRLDELPQLFNVMKGDMSIVGPRPIRKFFAERLGEQFPYYFLRFSVKPGLTGWAQVVGEYADTVEEQLRKLEYELFYINEYSLLLDAGILFRTMRKVFTGAGQ